MALNLLLMKIFLVSLEVLMLSTYQISLEKDLLYQLHTVAVAVNTHLVCIFF